MLGRHGSGAEGEALGFEELSSVVRSQWSSDSQSDSDSDSSVELMGGMVSRRGRPLDRGVARTYSKGRRWQKMRSVTSGQNLQS